MLGSALPLLPSLLWMAGSAAIFLWALGVDASYLLIAVGWWLVGRVLRSRREVAENLRARAAELSAERDRYTAEAVRLERTKIARELHDVVAHCMTVIVIQSRAGRHLLGSDPAAASEALDVIVAVAAEAEADIRALVNLMDPELTRPLTRSLLDELVTRAGATGATITAEITGDPDDLDPATAVVAHRVIQEAITNAFRHAPGAAIRIVLTGGPVFAIEVTNGPPLIPTTSLAQHDGNTEPEADSPGTWGSGRGLTGIRERVIGIGGEVTWGATSSGGWQVLARFPLRD
jgi:signal transduction histidine kinase